jgi:WS/DGAT/MGAT family acyltransferase
MDRLSPLDVSFLHMESPSTPMHVGAVTILRQPAAGPGLDDERFTKLIADRLSLVPRYRQKVAWVPGRFANPVWVDDEDFDVTFHVRRSALPSPGGDAELRDLAGRLMSRLLDRHRPLWEIYLVEGLSDGRVAVISKTHHAMVDGISALDIGTVLLDLTPEPREVEPDGWRPRPAPGAVGLVTDAVGDLVRRPAGLLDAAHSAVDDLRAGGERVLSTAGGILSSLRQVANGAPDLPLNVRIGQARRFGMAATDLADYKAVRAAHGGTVNDVVLATVTGALREWLLMRGEPVTRATTVRAMVPVSVRTEQERDLGNRVSSYFVDLPVGEPNPVVRLLQVSAAMRAHKLSGAAVGADALVKLSGFAPPTLLTLGARAASRGSSRVFNLVVTNVPGPQFPLYAGGARLLAVHPVVPLAQGQAVSIGLMSYDGGVYYGLNADRAAMHDVDVLADCLQESLRELVGTTRV